MKNLFLILITLFSFSSIRAEEGMLIPSLLEAFESDMKAMGMKISAEDIYNVNNASIKDAIFHFGGGCTAEIISDQGLLLTNYHCGYSQVYAHTTIENNLADNGFWSKSIQEELPNEGLTATRIVRIEDVTARIQEGLEGLSEDNARSRFFSNIARIKADATANTNYNAEIKAFDYGNSYYLLVKETFLDVRLVAAPPKSIGKFGGDLDNWVWPRHTGDFALFRIYTDKNNLPSTYHQDNVPYQPIHHLPISLKNREEGEFTMIFGFPGVTSQHTISSELAYLIHKTRPAQIKMRDLSLEVMNDAMRKSKETEINYASKQARIANAWKKWQGQIIGLNSENALGKKLAYEQRYTQKANSTPEWKEKYGDVTSQLVALSNQYNEIDFIYNMYIEYTYVGAELLKRARKVEEFIEQFQNEGISEDLKQLLKEEKQSAENFFEKYDKNIDQDIFKVQTDFYKENIDKKYLPQLFNKFNTEKLTYKLFKKSLLVDLNKYNKLLDAIADGSYSKKAKKFSKDIGIQLFNELEDIYSNQIQEDLITYYNLKNQLLQTYIAGKYEMFPDDKHWADANSTLRLSYGKLEGSSPKDGMTYDSHSTLKGVIEKYNTGEMDYEIQPRMLELYKNKEYGDYAQDGELWVCFTSSLHTTGGNSGSPILNGEGHLIGLNFDRSWESTMSDYHFDSNRCRNISVDIRYILWLIDIYGEATHIVQEMTIIK